ncbi:MAG: hypothetical protein H6665_14525 [Ardenticatenaceae bacterium]|nr:hypothetical protein [Ardenticatenaceae bacterium]
MSEYKWMNSTRLFFDGLFEMLGEILLAFIRRVAPFAVPAAPAFFFGHALFATVQDLSGNVALAVTIGGVAALGLESAGILAAHTAVSFYGRDDRTRAGLAALVAVFYLVVGIASIWFFESAGRDAQVAGTAMFLIAGAVYLLLGLADDAAEQERRSAATEDVQQQRQAEQVDHERQLELERLRFEQEQELERLRSNERVKLARIEAKSQHMPAQSQHEPARGNGVPALSQHVCPHCERPFGSVQALNAHKRFCSPETAVVGVNGSGHHAQ